MSRLDEIKARADAATPWHAWDRGIGWEVHKGEECAPGVRSCDELNGEFRGTFTREDAEFIAAASVDVPWLVAQVDRLEAWRVEALGIIDYRGEQQRRAEDERDNALAEVARLTAERDALAQIKRHIDEVRNGTGWTVQIYGVLLQQCDQYGKTIDTRRAERAEAERDALAAQVARVEKLAEWFDSVQAEHLSQDDCQCEMKDCYECGPWHACTHNGPPGRAWQIRAALAGSEADTSDTQPTDQEVSDE